LERPPLLKNTEGDFNTAIGDAALLNNMTGASNTAVGEGALLFNTAGINNTAVGDEALFANTGSCNIGLGIFAGGLLTTGDRNIDIGNSGVPGESDTIRIGGGGVLGTRTFIAGIRGTTTGNNDAVNVVIDSAGQLGTISSSRRFKKEIKPMDKASETILALKPVTFHYRATTLGDQN
jgi:hypothetical protein